MVPQYFLDRVARNIGGRLGSAALSGMQFTRTDTFYTFSFMPRRRDSVCTWPLFSEKIGGPSQYLCFHGLRKPRSPHEVMIQEQE